MGSASPSPSLTGLAAGFSAIRRNRSLVMPGKMNRLFGAKAACDDILTIAGEKRMSVGRPQNPRKNPAGFAYETVPGKAEPKQGRRFPSFIFYLR
jgi:hypothetical protein